MKLGLTLQTFLDALAAEHADERDIISFASGQGLDFVEIRNKNRCLDEARLNRIKAVADSLKITIQYAWDGGSLLDDDYTETYKYHLNNAEMFGAGTICRVIIDPQLIRSRETPSDYTEDEMDIIHKRLSDVMRLAEEKGVVLAYENSFESVSGFTGLLEKNPGMFMTLDTANFLNLKQQKQISNPAAVMQLYKKYQSAIPYVHIKSTKDGVLKDTFIADGDFDWRTFFRLYDGWTCLELPASDQTADCKKRICDSLKALRDILSS
jgi:sugar phosphate isomerase/epimerase